MRKTPVNLVIMARNLTRDKWDHLRLPTREKRVERWAASGADDTLRLDYDLDENAIVMDLGGFRGDWTARIYERYRCNVHVFEPVPQFANRIQSRFRAERKIRVHAFGLSDRTTIANLSLDDDASSVVPHDHGSAHMVEVRLVEAEAFLKEHRITFVDLMKINIEGAEYDLLEQLTHRGTVRQIGDIQVQFHDFVHHAKRRVRRIRKSLAESHYPTYRVDFVWENWRLRR